MSEQFGYRVPQVSYKDYREFCEKCKFLLSKVFVGNRSVTVYCSKMKCEHMPKEEEEMWVEHIEKRR